jgi:hypothetical protein
MTVNSLGSVAVERCGGRGTGNAITRGIPNTERLRFLIAVGAIWEASMRAMAHPEKALCVGVDWRFKMARTFMDRYLAGEVPPEAIDDFVDAWHEGELTISLAEFLGLSDEEYWRWVKDANALPDIRAAREVNA